MSPNEGPEARHSQDGKGAKRPPKLGTVLMWMVLMGLPFIITTQLMQANLDLATEGEQQGGPIFGKVLSESEGQPQSGVSVSLSLVRGEDVREFETVETDREGRFRFEAPAHQGAYRLHVGGGHLRRVVRNYSFLDGDGDEELQVELGPGATLSFNLESRKGARIAGGTIYIDARLRTGGAFAFFTPTLRLEQRFDGPSVLIDGLPPLEGRARLELDGGQKLELPFKLEEGQVQELSYTL